MASAVGELLAAARRRKRPRWSQQFLAEEAASIGIPVSRSQVARAERADPGTYNCAMVIGLAIALGVSETDLMEGLLADLRALHARITASIGDGRHESIDLAVHRFRRVAPPEA